MAVPVLGKVGKQADKVYSNHAKSQANIGMDTANTLE
jgi:hypothetical protein